MPFSPAHLSPVDPRVYCETMNELHSYITSSTRGFLTQAELFRYYRQRHDNVEIPYRVLGYRSLLDLLGSDHRLFAIDLRREPACVYSAVKLRQQLQQRRHGGNSTIYRSHHSTNALDEQHPQQHTPLEYSFFALDEDHNVPSNRFQPINVKLSDDEFHYQHEQTPVELNSTTLEQRPSTPDMCDRVETNVWQTPQSVEQVTNSSEENNDKSLVHEPIVLTPARYSPLPAVCLPSNMKFSPVKKDIPPPISSSDENNQRPTIVEPSIIKPHRHRRRLYRSISTSTSSLSTLNQSHDYFFLLSIIFSFVFVGIIVYKIC